MAYGLNKKVAKYTDKTGFTWESKQQYYKFLASNQSKSAKTRKKYKKLSIKPKKKTKK